jgi:exo-beta-1,3-glucanase (GH17 family)
MKSRSQWFHLGFTFALCVLTAFHAGCDSGGGGSGQGGAGPPPTIAYQVYGLNFGPYEDGQDPNLGAVLSAEQIERRMRTVAPYTRWVRTFGCTRGLEYAGAVAHRLQLKIAMGAWIGADPSANEFELEALIREARSGNVDLAIIGTEVLFRGDLSPAELIAYIRRFRLEVPNVPVTTSDTYSDLLDNPEVIAECGVILANYYPYWEGVGVNDAIAWLHVRHQRLVAAAGGKEVLVSETGWPTGGNTIADAVPSPENAAFYFKNFVSWARAEGVDYFYFEAFDELFKAAYEGPQGAAFGTWTADGELKPGMQAVFDGETVVDNWTCGDIPGGNGTPAIQLTAVPPIGSSGDLSGQVWHIAPGDYGIAVYIKVLGGWWTKPFWNDPVTSINCDGSWVCDITTGGEDTQATDIAAFLIPLTYTPPAATWADTLPAELYTNSLAYAEVKRD